MGSQTTKPTRQRGDAAPALLGGPTVWLAAGLLLVGAALVVAWLVLRAQPAGRAEVRPGPEPGAPTVTYQLRGDGEPVSVQVEVAATPEQRRQGLSNRRSVPEGTGMVFLFPEDDTGGFWMRETLVPLSIAYVAADGRVVSVHEMTPCTADPCPVYEPAGPYRYVLELPAGAYAAARVGPGDRVVPLDPEALPEPS